ncbi:hypothetical protein COLO4_15010 [Corchorus olitorius]|uniref:Uncharacterized protein n=1 Tax=Corchorus olitorius TaxID=93759 RepID=A0A1R3JQ68_9ROSI|nr:hypothetical protein COLO4_15010 [Corchorus olitorius]
MAADLFLKSLKAYDPKEPKCRSKETRTFRDRSLSFIRVLPRK